MKRPTSKLLIAGLLLAAAGAQAQSPGVTAQEIVIGTIQDLSGPVAGYSKPAVNGMQMRIDEANAAGGVHGRRIRLVVEDSGFDPKKGVLAAQKLLQKDHVFAMVGTLGTAIVGATMPMVLERKVPHLFPIAGSALTFEPLQPMKYQLWAPFPDTVRAALRHLIKAKGLTKVGILYQDDDFGLDILKGTEAGTRDAGQTVCEKTTYKRGATDFSSQIARLKSAGCDFVVLGTVVRETVGAMAEARKIGWNVEFLGTSAAFDSVIPRIGGKAVEGLHAISVQGEMPDAETANARMKQWMADYRRKFDQDATLYATTGYVTIDIFLRALEKAGASPTADSLDKALESLTVPRDFFGGPVYAFSRTSHLANRSGKITQIRNGKWVTLTDYLD